MAKKKSMVLEEEGDVRFSTFVYYMAEKHDVKPEAMAEELRDAGAYPEESQMWQNAWDCATKYHEYQAKFIALLCKNIKLGDYLEG